MSTPSAWWQDGIIYQIYPRSFMDSNGDGIGDLQGIVSQLDYLQWLGVDALWLSPFYPSPMADFGYDVKDYCAVDPIFGTLETFATLVEQAHRRNLRVIIDFVPNHTSDEHPWFLASRSSRKNAQRNWYVWADAQADGSPPNNWLSIMGGSAWEWDATTEQYYLHSFIKKQPDLNWRNPAVKKAMFDVVRFWLERGVDGFRVDAAHFILKDPQLRDNPLNLSGKLAMHKPMGAYDSQIHLYDKGHSDVHTVFRELRSLLDEYGTDRVILGEIHIFDQQEWVSYYGAELDEFHMPFNFALLNVSWSAQAILEAVNSLESHLPPGAWPNNVLGNHDESRIASRVGTAWARLTMLLLLTLRGTPTLYYGDELGMHDVVIPPELAADPQAKVLPSLGRDPARTPMQWNGTENAGFCSPAIQPWLPLADDYRQNNVAVERDDPHSLLTLTHRLITLRRSTSALTQGSYQAIEVSNPGCLVYLRQTHDQRYLMALNFSDQEQEMTLPESDSGQIVLSTHLDREEHVELAHFILRSSEGIVLQLPAEDQA